MRLNFTRNSYMPKHAPLTECHDAQTDAVAFTYETAGALYAIAFHGKAAKPDWHFRFADEARRASKIKAHFDGHRTRQAMKAETAARRAAPVALKVGDVLATSWGYEQTNVDFFQVTALVGARMVELREIAQERAESGGWSGTTNGIRGAFVGEPLRRRVKYGSSVKIDDCRTGSLWDGRPKHWSSGH